jgi:hypothetical protein
LASNGPRPQERTRCSSAETRRPGPEATIARTLVSQRLPSALGCELAKSRVGPAFVQKGRTVPDRPRLDALRGHRAATVETSRRPDQVAFKFDHLEIGKAKGRQRQWAAGTRDRPAWVGHLPGGAIGILCGATTRPRASDFASLRQSQYHLAPMSTFHPFKLHLRSYAPFKTFGMGFEGDNRRATTAGCVSSRISVVVAFDPCAGSAGLYPPRSSPTTFLPIGLTKTETPVARLGVVKLARGIFIQVDAAGANPVVPGAPSIDVHLRFEAAVSGGRLNISASLRGDAFPSAEVFLEDRASRRRMLQRFETAGGRHTGPLTMLWGNTQRFMHGICDSIAVNESLQFV